MRDNDPWWVTPCLIVLAAGIFLIALGMAFLANDKSLLNVMCGAAIAIAQSAFNWRFGSSKGSADKDATVAAATAALATSFPAAPAVPAMPPAIVDDTTQREAA